MFAVFACAAPLRAQDVEAVSVTAVESGPAATAMRGGMILVNATGAQFIQAPKAWERTWAGFGYRVADRVGYAIVQESTYRTFTRALDLQPDAAPCARGRIVPCAFTATFTSFDSAGRRRANTPLFASLAIGAGTSLFWRPERHDPAKAWAFVGTRMGISAGANLAARIVVDWWAQRPR